VNQFVHKIKVTNYTLLGKHTNQDGTKEYKDAYQVQLPRQFKLVQGTGSSKEISVVDLARAFFTCRVFERAEKPILRRLTQVTSECSDVKLVNYKAFKFKEGDQYLVWRVIDKDMNEILLQWEYGGLKGTTWFCVPVRDNTLLFGSSFPRPQLDSVTPTVEDFITSKPKELFIDASSNLNPNINIPLKDKIRNYFLKLSYRLSVPVHQIYSKFLLESTMERLLEMKEELPFEDEKDR